MISYHHSSCSRVAQSCSEPGLRVWKVTYKPFGENGGMSFEQILKLFHIILSVLESCSAFFYFFWFHDLLWPKQLTIQFCQDNSKRLKVIHPFNNTVSLIQWEHRLKLINAHLLITLFEIFIFCPKIQLWFSEKIVDFSGVKNSWKCCGFSCWQLWFREKNCQKNIGRKTRENVGVLSKLNFGQKIYFSNSV